MSDHYADRSTPSIVLVGRAQKGDLGALERLVGRYYTRVRDIVRIRMGGALRTYEHGDEGDILQATFVKALEIFERFEVRDEGSLIHWLAKIAENQMRQRRAYHEAEKRDKRRERRLEHLRNAMVSGSIAFDVIDPGIRPDNEAADDDDLEMVMRCAEKLSAPHREVIVQRHLIHASDDWERIAEAIGAPSRNAARMTYVRARAELQRIVDWRADGDASPSGS